MSPRRIFVVLSLLGVCAVLVVSWLWCPALWALALVLPLVALGTFDMLQTKHAILRNFPFLGRITLIEIKLSQGAKPGHGGILPAKKVTLEIAQIRHVPVGQDVISPPTHGRGAARVLQRARHAPR